MTEIKFSLSIYKTSTAARKMIEIARINGLRAIDFVPRVSRFVC